MCMSNNGRKGVEDAAAVQEVESEVRLSLWESPSSKAEFNTAALPTCNHCSEIAGSSFCVQQVRKALREAGLNAKDVGV